MGDFLYLNIQFSGESEGIVPAKFEQIDVSEIHLRPDDEQEEGEENDFGSSREEDESTHFDGFDMNGNDSDNDSCSNKDDTNNDTKLIDGSSSDEFHQKEDSSDEDFVVKRYSTQKRKSESDIPPGKRKRGRPRKEIKALRKGPRGKFKCPIKDCHKFFTRRYRIDFHIKIKHGHRCDECEHR